MPTPRPPSADKNVGTGKTVTVTGITITGADAGNYVLASTTATTTANITPLALTVSATGVNKVYDGTTDATVTLTDNRVAGDSLHRRRHLGQLHRQERGHRQDRHGRRHHDHRHRRRQLHLANTTATTTANITPLTLTVSATGVNKVYDGTTAATVTLTDNRVAGDSLDRCRHLGHLRRQERGHRQDRDCHRHHHRGGRRGQLRPGQHHGDDHGEHHAARADRQRHRRQQGLRRSTDATVTLTDNRVAGDVFTDADTSASFADKNVGTGKAVTVSRHHDHGHRCGQLHPGQHHRNDHREYHAAHADGQRHRRQQGLRRDHGRDRHPHRQPRRRRRLHRCRHLGHLRRQERGHRQDGDRRRHPITGHRRGQLRPGQHHGDDHGEHHAADADGQRHRRQTRSTTGPRRHRHPHRQPRRGDVFTDADTSASFADKNVGTGKTVTVSGITITGTDAGNYYVANTTATTTANITPLTLTVSATGATRSTTAPPTATVTLSETASRATASPMPTPRPPSADKNVGTGKTVTVSGITITGTDAGNYSLASTSATTTANITPLHADGQRHRRQQGLRRNHRRHRHPHRQPRRGDVFTDADTSASFADKNVGTGKAVTVAGISITGTDAGNYIAGQHHRHDHREHHAAHADGQRHRRQTRSTTEPPTATVTLTDNRVAGDVFTDADTSATFADKNVGTGKTVTVSRHHDHRHRRRQLLRWPAPRPRPPRISRRSR